MHHSTEATLLAVHDHIIKSITEQKVTALCLLGLSAAFDTIFIILLSFIASRFGFDGEVISSLLLIYHLVALLFLSTLFPLLTLSFVK